MKKYAKKYIHLIKSLLQEKISYSEFEKNFSHLFKYDGSRPKELYDVLLPLFWAVEDFCSIPELRDDSDIDENQLLSTAEEVLKNIELLCGTNTAEEALMNILREMARKQPEPDKKKVLPLRKASL